MKFEDVKVGQKVKLVSGKVGEKYEFTNSFTQSMMEFIGKEFTVGSVGKAGVYFGVCCDNYGFPWECLEPVEDKFSLTNTKINVQKYADDNGLTLAAACKEIQEWLFAQGYEWSSNKKEVLTCVFNYIFTDSFAASELTHIDAEDNFENHRNKEITLQRTVAVTLTLTPSFVEPVAESVEYVELGGKLYVKTDLEAALSSIVAIENDVVETCCECDNPIRRNRYASFKGKHYHIECL